MFACRLQIPYQVDIVRGCVDNDSIGGELELHDSGTPRWGTTMCTMHGVMWLYCNAVWCSCRFTATQCKQLCLLGHKEGVVYMICCCMDVPARRAA